MQVAIDEVRAALDREGCFVSKLSVPQGEEAPFITALARSLGQLYVPPDCDPDEPVIRTDPTEAEEAPPFDRPEAIGWHGDFATHEDRPELSLVYITRPDPRGGEYGAWRLASVAEVLGVLRESTAGGEAFDLLRRVPLPMSYDEAQEPKWFKVIEPRPEGKLGLRFYAPSIRRGCQSAYGQMPAHVNSALSQLEHAADQVQRVVPTEAGSLLVTSNWFGLHDRVQQTVNPTGPNREALLSFVSSVAPALKP